MRLAGLLYLWLEGVRSFKVYEAALLDRSLAAEEQERHQKFLNDLVKTGRFFEARLREITIEDLNAFNLEQESFLTTMRELEEWKETLNGQV